MRYTKKDVESAFGILCRSLGKRVATKYNDVGAWRLDHAACYGGYVIEEITSESGGVKQPFGSRRRSASEFCDCVRFAVDAVDVTDRDKGKCNA